MYVQLYIVHDIILVRKIGPNYQFIYLQNVSEIFFFSVSLEDQSIFTRKINFNVFINILTVPLRPYIPAGSGSAYKLINIYINVHIYIWSYVYNVTYTLYRYNQEVYLLFFYIKYIFEKV